VLRLLRDFNETYGKTVVIITHNASIGQMGNRVVTVRDGMVERFWSTKRPFPPEEVAW
jgi:putative ABC transport system ATP-binding protein